MERQLSVKRHGFETRGAALDAMSPMRVLSRGYAIAENEKGSVVRSVDELAPDEAIAVLLRDGRVDCRVLKTSKGE